MFFPEADGEIHPPLRIGSRADAETVSGVAAQMELSIYACRVQRGDRRAITEWEAMGSS